MLFLQLKSGEYLTIGEEIAVQVFHGPGTRIRVAVKAPKEVSILRGEVWDRNGEARPEGLIGFTRLTSWLKYKEHLAFG